MLCLFLQLVVSQSGKSGLRSADMVLNNYLGISACGWTRNFLIAISRSLQGTGKKQGWARVGATAVGAHAQGWRKRLPLACSSLALPSHVGSSACGEQGN